MKTQEDHLSTEKLWNRKTKRLLLHIQCIMQQIQRTLSLLSSFSMIFCSRVEFLCFNSCLASVLCTGPLLQVVKFTKKVSSVFSVAFFLLLGGKLIAIYQQVYSLRLSRCIYSKYYLQVLMEHGWKERQDDDSTLVAYRISPTEFFIIEMCRCVLVIFSQDASIGRRLSGVLICALFLYILQVHWVIFTQDWK